MGPSGENQAFSNTNAKHLQEYGWYGWGKGDMKSGSPINWKRCEGRQTILYTDSPNHEGCQGFRLVDI